LAQAAELAPVFGLAGTLISLSQLPSEGFARGAFTGAISMAVITTLYGLLSANLLLAPLARMVERKAQAEEAERQEMIDWLAAQIAKDMPPTRRGTLAAVPAEAV
jgi:chemotaxis protein MotA